MRSTRSPAVAGLFYPESASELRAMVEGLLAAGRTSSDFDGGLAAVIAPHAGYVYSGAVAGSAFRQLRDSGVPIERVAVLGPAHRVPVEGLALPESSTWVTPLGEVPVDAELVELVAGLPQVTSSEAAHAPEHSLEVELPFLQVLAPGLRLLPLVVGGATAEEVAAVIERIWQRPDTFVVISSDLSHYLPYQAARRLDRDTAEMISRLEPRLSPERACGAAPVNGLLLAAARRGMEARLLDLRSSGDTAGGRHQVVGYGAFAVGTAA